MRFHVVALPHTNVTAEFSSCAYTNKVRGFCRMMMDRGHEVFLYAGEKNEAPCTEHIACISEEMRAEVVSKVDHYTSAPFDPDLPHWRVFNANAATEIRKRMEPTDFLCLIGGLAHKRIAELCPEILAVEWGVGYAGTFTNFRVFESYAWMHTMYGAQSGGAAKADGRFFDAVIPGYLDPAQFPYRGDHRRGNDYFLYVGRLIDRKGWRIAQEVCEHLGKRLIVAGAGQFSGYGEYFGVANEQERNTLMAGATAVFVPTRYLEPFGNVCIEAMACGTPVITTDWGAMTETVIDGVTGFRCRTLQEFIDAAERAHTLDHQAIRRHVVRNYSLKVIGEKYERYFERLSLLRGNGWYQLREPAGSLAA